jgi:predicted Zn-dependent protease
VVAKSGVLTATWATKTGKEPTPGGGGGFGRRRRWWWPWRRWWWRRRPYALQGTENSLEKLIGSVERGLLITHFWYIRLGERADAAGSTGLTRRRSCSLILKRERASVNITAPV